MILSYESVGIIHSPFEDIKNVPIQPASAIGIRGSVEVFAEFDAGLKGLAGFSHIILLYHFHRVTDSRLILIPFLDREARGVFATRAPTRPNPIGLSVVRLLSIDGNVMQIENVDIVDGTPLLDIKPYVPQFDHYKVERTGWLTAAEGQIRRKKSDDRFG
jgi:tRNA (adenine37-N6)-methyltransferase